MTLTSHDLKLLGQSSYQLLVGRPQGSSKHHKLLLLLLHYPLYLHSKVTLLKTLDYRIPRNQFQMYRKTCSLLISLLVLAGAMQAAGGKMTSVIFPVLDPGYCNSDVTDPWHSMHTGAIIA